MKHHNDMLNVTPQNETTIAADQEPNELDLDQRPEMPAAEKLVAMAAPAIGEP